MIATLTYGKHKKELNTLVALEKDIAAYAGDEKWNYELCLELAQVKKFFEDSPLLDMMCYEVTEGEALSYLEEIRKQYRQMHLLLLADQSLSPMAYLRPGIMANALLLRPWSVEQAKSVLREFIASLMERKDSASLEENFVIDGKEGRITIPYQQIYYFEAREKKIFACTGKEEFGFYNTMEGLEKELPESFVRCHRGFIVNRQKIRKIMLSRNLIILADGFEIPLSRSYKATLKGLGK